MSASSLHRVPSVAAGCLLLAVAAMGMASLAIHPPRALRHARLECQVSGRVTSQDRVVTRGTICFSCVIIPDSPEIESFPDVTVRIVDGDYVISDEDGLTPGRYEVTIRAQEVAAEAADPPSPGGKRVRYPTHDLITVISGSPTFVDFELASPAASSSSDGAAPAYSTAGFSARSRD